MEQRLNADYLKPGIIEWAIATALVAVGIGFGISLILAALGWRDSHSVVVQTPPVVIEQPESNKAVSRNEHGKVQEKSSTNEVIRREVTVFWSVNHLNGEVMTGWVYHDGAGRVPTRQFCYYSTRNPDFSIRRVDLALDQKPLSTANSLLPDVEAAFAKCHWWS
jgi:hypothetical protein